MKAIDDPRIVATKTHNFWLARQFCAGRTARIAASSHGLAFGLITPLRFGGGTGGGRRRRVERRLLLCAPSSYPTSRRRRPRVVAGVGRAVVDVLGDEGAQQSISALVR